MSAEHLIKPGATIGIMGGGQLGRMLVLAAARMGYKTHIFTPEEASPASQIATHTTIAAYDDAAKLEMFAKQVDVITFEFENVPADAITPLAEHTQIHPKVEILHLCRHRMREKSFINAQAIATAPWLAVRSAAGLTEAVAALGCPSVLKTCELGYDGKGQMKITSAQGLENLWASLGSTEAVLEGWVPFEREISVIVARGASGAMVCYEPMHNMHEHHILARTVVPAKLPSSVADAAQNIAKTLAEALELVGILAVEMFLLPDGALLVNELAPRAHNSGHWTIEAAATSQFEQQIRAICGHALGDASTLCPAEMVNLIGDDIFQLDEYLANPKAHLHLYGKAQARKGRKMGHVTVLNPSSCQPHD